MTNAIIVSFVQFVLSGVHILYIHVWYNLCSWIKKSIWWWSHTKKKINQSLNKTGVEQYEQTTRSCWTS